MLYMHRRWMLFIYPFFVLVPALCAQQTLQNVPAELVRYPDQILYNGKIAIMDDASLSAAQGRTVQALAIARDRILFIGSNDEVMRYAGPKTRKIDLKGRTVVPGMINTHTHIHDHALWDWAAKHPKETDEVMKRISVGGANFEELTKGIQLVIKENAGKMLPGQWAWLALPNTGESVSTSLGYRYLASDTMTRQKLDDLAPATPIFLHAPPKWILNTAARNAFLNMYDVPLTQEAEEVAMENDTTFRRALMVDGYFRYHLDELADIVGDAMKHQGALGFTSFSSHIEPQRVHDAYMKMVRAGTMPIRMAYADSTCEQADHDKSGCLVRRSDIAGLGDKYFWSVGVTLRGIDADPPEICSTMEMPKEYKDREKCLLSPGSAGAKATKIALLSHLRFIPNHSYGDKGLDQFMDIVDQVMKEDPTITPEYIHSLRLTADHCGFYPRKAQIPRMAKMGMIISCGAQRVGRGSAWVKAFGGSYADRIAPAKSMLSGGLMTVAEGELEAESGQGSTAFAEYMPLINRMAPNGDILGPDEAIDRVSLLKMTTVWSSYYVLKEKELGTLEPGKFADLLVLNKDYFSVPENEIPGVYPVMVMVGGKPLVVREEYAAEAGLPAVGPQMKWTSKLGTHSETNYIRNIYK